MRGIYPWRPLGAILLLLLADAGSVQADKTVSRDAALQAIAVFQKDASSAEGVSAASTIMAFVRTSDAVHVSLSKAAVPWLKGGPEAPDADTRGMLLTAYIAGNIHSQLAGGKSGDDVYAGWQQVLATYAQLLEINPAAKIAEVDDLKKKEAAGNLRAYAAEVQRK